MIHIVKVSVGREFVVANAIRNMTISRNLNIKAIFFTRELKGLLFVEGEFDHLTEIMKEIPAARGISRTVSIDDIKKYFEVKEEKIEIEVGDIVEIVGGPFKGEKAKVSKLDPVKKEVVVDLLESTVPLPLTISISMVKIIEKAKKS